MEMTVLIIVLAACCLLAWYLMACAFSFKEEYQARYSQILLCSALIFVCAGSILFEHLMESFEFPGSWFVWPLIFTVAALLILGWLAVKKPIANPKRPLKYVKFLFFWIPRQQEILPEEDEEEEPSPLEENFAENAQQLALELDEADLDSICTHRSEVVRLSLKDSPEKWRKTLLDNRFNFYPVTNESGDDIVGVLDARDYFRLDNYDRKTILDKAMDQPLFVAENMTPLELLHLMKQRRTYFAIVLDEYGGFTGVVSLHDIVEEIFGKLHDENDPNQPADITKLPRNVWRINGEADLEDVSKALGMKLELDEFETFSGYILGSLGYIPEDGTQLEVKIGPLNIQIKRIAGHRIRQTLVRVDEPDAKEIKDEDRSHHA